MARCVMVVGAHADDVELHFGGTLFKYMDQGYEVVYVMSTNNMSGSRRIVQPDGMVKSEHYDVRQTMEFRKCEAAEAARLFKTIPIHLDHPQRHCNLDDGQGGVRKVEVRYGSELPPVVPPDVPTILTAYSDPASQQDLADLLLQRDPEVVFTHGFGETNPEHYCTFLLAVKSYGQAVQRGYKGALLGGVRNFRELALPLVPATP
ncbi:MAG: PIG-L deacetylase family protein [Kiritimatiellia bacterium]